jgi:hypothetical protein
MAMTCRIEGAICYSASVYATDHASSDHTNHFVLKVGESIEIPPHLGVGRTGDTARADGRELDRSRMRTRSPNCASSRTGYWHELLMCDPARARIIDSWPLTPTPQASRTQRPSTAAAVAGTTSSQTHPPAVRSRSAPSGQVDFPPPPARSPPRTSPRAPRLGPPARPQHRPHHHLLDIGDSRTSGRDPGRRARPLTGLALRRSIKGGVTAP